MAFAPYTTGTELLDYMQVAGSGKAALADAAVTASSHAIDEHCQRHFWQDVGATRTFMPTNLFCLELGPFNDLVSLTSLKTDPGGDGTYEVVWSASDYQLQPPTLLLGRPYTAVRAVGPQIFPAYGYGYGGANALNFGYYGFNIRQDRVQIVGTFGWAAVPSEVVFATKIKAARLYLRHQSANGIAGLDNFGPIRVSQFEDPDVVSLLAPYRHPDTTVLVA
jgi:hypothetical protein